MPTIFYRASIFLVVTGLVSFGTAQIGTDNAPVIAHRGSFEPGLSGVSGTDQKFIKEAAQGCEAEVELGRLAAQKGSSDDVKAFGQRMVKDHGRANDQLHELALNKEVKLPVEIGAKERATKDRLSKLSGQQFDKAYLRDMLQDHGKDVAAFERESNAGKDTDVRNFATQTLPTLQDHLKDANKIAQKVLQERTVSQPSAASLR